MTKREMKTEAILRKESLSLLSCFISFVLIFFSISIIPGPFPLVDSCFALIKKDDKITINFVDVDLSTLAKFISSVTGKNFIFDERLKGKITVIAPSKLKPDDAYNLFVSMLALKDFTVVPVGADSYKIVPSREAKAQGLEVFTGRTPINGNYSVRLIQVKYISTSDAMRLLKPIISPDGYIEVIGDYMMVVDSGLNIEKILAILDDIDQPVTVGDFEVVHLKYISAETMAKILNDSLAAKAKTPAGQTQTLRALADQRLSAVILFGDKIMRDSMKELIFRLDVAAPREIQGRIHVYSLKNADATELGKVLEDMLKGMQGGASRQTVAGAAPQAPLFESGTIITPDKTTNSLLIVASPADYQNIVQIVEQLDKRRRQVFVEAMIVEADINELRNIGANWRAIASSGNQKYLVGGFGTVSSTTLDSVVTGLSGVSVGGISNLINVNIPNSTGTSTTTTIPQLAALFSIDQLRNVVNVLSVPQILTSDNKEAEIVVGENVPFISQTQAGVVGTSGTSGILDSITRQDVGIKLTIKPQITEGDYVNLDIYQEISAVESGTSDAVLTSIGPSTSKRSTKTSITVKDGRMIVIGGLISTNYNKSLEKIPYLGDIPVLGWLFRNDNTSLTKENLLIFITPHIVKDERDLAQLTRDKEDEYTLSSYRNTEEEILVKFKDGVSDEKARSIILKNNATLIQQIQATGVYRVRVQEGLDLTDVIKSFSAIPDVQFAEPIKLHGNMKEAR